MTEEIKKEAQKIPDPETKKEEGKETKPETKEEKDLASLQAAINADLRGKYVPKEVVDKIQEELEGVKGATKIVERIKQAIDGSAPRPTEEEIDRARFYKLLVEDPKAAIAEVAQGLRQKEKESESSKKAKEMFESFTKIYPEYKEFEEEMKEEMVQNPNWFGKEDFIRKVFFTVLMDKNPELLMKLLNEDRTKGVPVEKFVFEKPSQTLHGDEPTSKTIIDRMKSAGGAPSSYFD